MRLDAHVNKMTLCLMTIIFHKPEIFTKVAWRSDAQDLYLMKSRKLVFMGTDLIHYHTEMRTFLLVNNHILVSVPRCHTIHHNHHRLIHMWCRHITITYFHSMWRWPICLKSVCPRRVKTAIWLPWNLACTVIPRLAISSLMQTTMHNAHNNSEDWNQTSSIPPMSIDYVHRQNPARDSNPAKHLTSHMYMYICICKMVYVCINRQKYKQCLLVMLCSNQIRDYGGTPVLYISNDRKLQLVDDMCPNI